MASIRLIGLRSAQVGTRSGGRLLWDSTWENEMSPEMTPERLVGLGFRGWMSGYEYQDVSCWEHVWNTYAANLGPAVAKQAVTELSCWVRELRHTSCRRISVYPIACGGFCRDECIAISVIAAAQNGQCPALRACAYALTEAPRLDALIDEAQNFAGVLSAANQHLSNGVVCNIAGLAEPPATGRPN